MQQYNTATKKCFEQNLITIGHYSFFNRVYFMSLLNTYQTQTLYQI